MGKRVNNNSFSDDISREKFHEGFLASTFGSSLPDEDPVASNGEILRNVGHNDTVKFPSHERLTLNT